MSSQAWKTNLPLIIAGGSLFPPKLQLLDENVNTFYRRMKLFSHLSMIYFPQMDLADRRVILSQYCQLFGSNTTPFPIQLQVISDILVLLGHLRSSLATHPQELSDILYSLLVAFVRKAEDVQSFVHNADRARERRPQFLRDDFSNARFNAFIKNEVYTPPSFPYDKYGIHFAHNKADAELGDIVIYVHHSHIFDLFLHLCKDICQIISFFKPQTTDVLSTSAGVSSLLRSPMQQTHGVAPNPNAPMRVGVPGAAPAASPMNPTPGGANTPLNSSAGPMNAGTNPSGSVELQPLPFTERFIQLMYRFIIAFFNCGGLYCVEVHRPQETVRFGKACEA